MSRPESQELGELYRLLYLTRALEERLEQLVEQGQLVGGVYRSLGQEATAVGAAYALEDGDWLAPAIRDLGALLVRGVHPRAILRQYAARAGAPGGGRDTAHYFTVPELGLLGPIAPLGTQLCVLNGVALAFRVRGQRHVCLSYQGEGATRTGAAHEGLAFAAAQRLPMVVMLEHNRWAFATRSDREAAVRDWTDVARAYGVPAIPVDGNDVLAVYEAARQAVARARSGLGLTLIVAETYRMRGHAPHDPPPRGPDEELEEWRARDPLDRFQRYLRQGRHRSRDDLAAIRRGLDEELDAAVAEVLAAPPPDPGEARSRVYAAPEPDPTPWTRRSPIGYADLPVPGLAPAVPAAADEAAT